ncbi:hypothetical protein I3842_02G090300 [Carya illinoinensis]|uniref:Inosine/uridine-preferring nucleoside hydrolase domain-containing protein n=1 Tax=Carya illinoinensis TaxID=32201 RepID=A0A922FQM0_CARIL|nr:hypothetical protein I3842_02G090300 [Carya illinoinensis]
MAARPKKIIIDTDPGIAMAIFLALRSPEVELIGLTTIYGNVYTTLATRNALHLLEVAGRTDIPVAEGSHVTITLPFLIEQANLYPGKVTVVALGPLTNIALALQQDPAFSKIIGQIVLLGGAFGVNGHVHPAAETNVTDIVFTSGVDILVVGVNVTHQVVLTDDHRQKLARSDGKFAQYLCKILEAYFSFHLGIYIHDPTALLAAVDPSLITYTERVVRVQTCGITRGLTILYNKQKRISSLMFGEVTEWTAKPKVKVAVTADAPAILNLVMERLMDS